MAMMSTEPVQAWNKEISRSRTLPYQWYSLPEVFQEERERIFRRSWQFLGFTSELANPGDAIVGDVGGVPVVAVRDRDGKLRAHVNVCRHRGHAVVKQAGRYAALSCTYHGWTYALDGSLRGAPLCHHEPHFDRAQLGLLPVRIDTWGPVVFVNLDPDAASVREWMGAASDHLLSTGVKLDKIMPYARYDRDIDANWKVMSENNLECYHCPIAHPTLRPSFQGSEVPDVFTFVASGQAILGRSVPKKRDGTSGDTPDEPVSTASQSNQRYLGATLFPNVQISAFSDDIEHGILVMSWVPLSPTRTHQRADYLFSADPGEELRNFVPFVNQLIDEDVALSESAQRGMDAGVLPYGRAMPYSEPGVEQFDEMVYSALERKIITDPVPERNA